MSDTPKADPRSQMWTNTLHDTSDEAAKAAAAAEDARKGLAGVEFAAEGDRAFLENKYKGEQFVAQQRQSQAQFGAQQYRAREFEVRTHNAPYEAELLRAAEDARTQQILQGTAAMVTTAVAATAAVGAVDYMREAHPSMATTSFAGLSGGGGEPTTMSMGATSMFGRLAASPATLGIAPTLMLAGVAIDSVAKASPVVQAELEQQPTTTPAAAPVAAAPAQPARPTYVSGGAALELHHDAAMRNGPKRPSWASENPGGSIG